VIRVAVESRPASIKKKAAQKLSGNSELGLAAFGRGLPSVST
jgi:hypothetical protein